MAGIENKIIYGQGFKLQPSDSDDIARMQNTNTASFVNYNATPEGAVSANIGSLTIDRIAGNLYIKKTGTGNTGWQLFSSSVTTSFASIQFVSGNLAFNNTNLVLGSTLSSLTSGNNNVGFGAEVLQNVTSGEQNAGFGIQALGLLTTGAANTAIGRNSQASLINGNSNTSTGQNSLFSNVSGSNNTAYGAGALQSYAGSNNTAYGYLSCRDVTAGGNTGVGFIALVNCGTGANNTAVGYQGLTNISSGNNNTTLGYNAGSGLTLADSNNLFLGANVAGTAGDSNKTIIGSGQTYCQIAGIAGVNVSTPEAVSINPSTGQLGSMVGSPQVMIKSADVDLKTVGNTTIFTPIADFIVTGITPYAKTLSGTIGSPVVNVGTNAANFDNIISGIGLSSTQGNSFYYVNNIDSITVPSGTPLVVRVSTGDATATTNTQVFYITGFYL